MIYLKFNKKPTKPILLPIHSLNADLSEHTHFDCALYLSTLK